MPGEIDEQQLDKVRDEIKAGRKMAAIKLYMELSGSTLAESQAFIEKLTDELGDAVLKSEPETATGCSAAILLFVVSAAASALAWSV